MQPRLAHEIELAKARAIERCNAFRDMQVWPLAKDLNAEAWLSNFNETELPLAIPLLRSFLFINSQMINRLLIDVGISLAQDVLPREQSGKDRCKNWKAFLDRVIVTRITDEIPNDTDSGFLFARLARQVLEIPQSHIMSPKQALEAISNSKDGINVLFIDDFIGSGNQFLETWERQESVGTTSLSFSDASQLSPNTNFYLCPLLATTSAIKVIKKNNSKLSIRSAHTLTEEYCIFSDGCPTWSQEKRKAGRTFLLEASKRAGLSETNYKGFHDLGLSLAFQHGVPDATLPIFYSQANNWKPLVRRS